MDVKRVSIGDMFGWIANAFSLVFANPARMFGAGFLMVVVAFALSLPSFLVMGPTMIDPAASAPPDFSQLLPRMAMVYGLMLVLNIVLMPALILGWMRLVRDTDQNRSTGPTAIFKPYSDTAAWMAGIRLSLLTIAISLLVIGLIVAAFWAPLSGFFTAVAQAQAAPASGLAPTGMQFLGTLVLAYFVLLLAMLLLQFAYLLGMTELALRGGTAMQSLGAGLRAVFSNVLRLVLWMLVLFVLAFVAALVVVLVLGLLVAVLTAISQSLAMVAMMALYVPILILVYPLMHAGTYMAWKDMLGGDDSQGTDTSGEVSA